MDSGYENEPPYRQVVDERENLFGWFRTPPGPPPAQSTEMIVLVTGVLANEQEREKQKNLAFSRRCREAALRRRCRSVPKDLFWEAVA